MSAGLTVAGAGLLLFAPGALTAVASGLRGFPVVGAAPALSLGTYSLAAVVYAVTGVPWTPLSVGVVVVLVPLAVLLVRRPWRQRGAGVDGAGVGVAGHLLGEPGGGLREWARHLAPLAVWAVASAVVARSVVRATQVLEQPNQYWDAMFHTNAVHLIATTHDISPGALAPLAQPANESFYYPNVFHGAVSLLVQLGQDSDVVAINSVVAVLPAAFAAGAALLAWYLLRSALAATAAAGLATVTTAFPYELFSWGPIWPYTTAVSIVAASCALTLSFVRRPGVGPGIVAVLALFAVIQTQAAAGAACVVMTAVVAFVPLVTRLREDPRGRGRYLAGLGIAAAALVVLDLPLVAGLTGQGGGEPADSTGTAAPVDWLATENPGSALGKLFTFSEELSTPQWLLAALLLTGALAATARRVRGGSLLVVLGVFAGLYTQAAAHDTDLSLQLTSLWWNDRRRLAALFAVVAVVLCAAGVQFLAEQAAALVRRVRLPGVPAVGVHRAAVVVSVLVVAVALLLATDRYRERNESQVASSYGNGPTLSDVEAEGYDAFADIYAGEGTVLNDPNDGSAFAYADHDLPVVFKSPLTPPYHPSDIGADRLLLLRSFDEIDTDEAVQEAAERLDVEWVVISSGFTDWRQERAPGLDDLNGVESLEVAFRNPEFSVYRLTLPGRG